MLLLAQFEVIQQIVGGYLDTLGPAQFAGLFLVLCVTAYIIAGARTHLALLILLTLSLLTTADNRALASSAQLGRWYFLFLAGFTALMRPAPGDVVTLSVLAAYAVFNLVGIVLTTSIEQGLVRAIFYIVAVPAFTYSMGAARFKLDDLVLLLRRASIVGVILAVMHVIFMAIFGGGTGIARFKSFYTSPQTMSLATAAITLPMIWLLISKSAGKWFWIILGATMINILVMIASTQRTGLFSLAISSMILLGFYRARGALIAIGGGGIFAVALYPLIGMLVSTDFLAERLTSLDTQGRFEIWQIAWEKSLESPLIGHGTGAATDFSEKNFGKKFHQAYLSALYDGGIIGLVLFVAIIGRGLLVSWTLRKSKDERHRAIGAFGVASIFQVASQGFAETALADTTNETATLFYITLGIVSAALTMRAAEATRQAAPRTAPAAAPGFARVGGQAALPPNHYSLASGPQQQ